MRSKLKNVHLIEDLFGKSIVLDWTNGQHHAVLIQGQGTVDDVKNALISMAHFIDQDCQLKFDPQGGE